MHPDDNGGVTAECNIEGQRSTLALNPAFASKRHVQAEPSRRCEDGRRGYAAQLMPLVGFVLP